MMQWVKAIKTALVFIHQASYAPPCLVGKGAGGIGPIDATKGTKSTTGDSPFKGEGLTIDHQSQIVASDRHGGLSLRVMEVGRADDGSPIA